MYKINLFCLPFAGGSRHSYRGYVKKAPGHIRVIPLELPGRGSRYNERLLTNTAEMVEDLYSTIQPQLQAPYAIYGHSMGTLLGYLLTKKIIQEGAPQPMHLIFTGCGGPSVRYDGPPRHTLPRDEFIEKLRKLGGSPDEILADEGLIGFFEPIIRADFQAIETYEYTVSHPFDIPITVAYGMDEVTDYEKACAWKMETTAETNIITFPGKHFFIFEHEEQIMELIADKLTLLNI